MFFSYKDGLRLLIDYAYSIGCKEVDINHTESLIEWNDGTINCPNKLYINRGHSLEIKTYVMLHELGHYELRKDLSRFKKLLPVSYDAEILGLSGLGGHLLRRDSFVVSNLEEEYMAWDEGLRLGLEMGIVVDMKKWVRLRTKCLKTYIIYYGNKLK